MQKLARENGISASRFILNIVYLPWGRGNYVLFLYYGGDIIRKLLIVGAGGHGRCCLDIIRDLNCYDEISFYKISNK